MTKLTYGTFSFDENENWFDIDKRVVHSQIGERMNIVVRWTVWGVRKAATNAALQTAMNDLEDALSNDNQDLIFLDNNGNASPHSITSADSLRGTKVVSFRWLKGNPGLPSSYGSGREFTTRRSYEFVVQAELPDPAEEIVQWHESVHQIGDGGPRWFMMGSLNGAVQRQDVQQFTPYRVIQQGFAVGYTTWPNAPAALFPTALHRDSIEPRPETPRKFGRNMNTLFPIRWKYVFESATALTGGPTFF